MTRLTAAQILALNEQIERLDYQRACEQAAAHRERLACTDDVAKPAAR